ncbi:hypothetical protein [Goodfellowiella coeruleoviolacea]|uniref:Uncharacterized protein n=1 Tax=Goodfellowiella coeruleoviolacea TaxID=334858 RepID=A0AAE3GK22_9PSEU|nr:hypothetical protein [Goodfellowiella coeruleoviolacea]MCP2168852.1 hypothetical protein [Goodfellowiella coeruleoviolacea]
MHSPASWKLASPPETPASIAVDLVELREPLVRVTRTEAGDWCFDGPGEARELVEEITLGDVVRAWPHVAVLRMVQPGETAVWNWAENGWHIAPLSNQAELSCADLADSAWPEDLPAEDPAVVERAVVTGEALLTDVQRDDEGFSFVGPGEDELSVDAYVLVRLADAVRRWPHSFGVVRALQPGEGVEWDAEELRWDAYRLTYPTQPEL